MTLKRGYAERGDDVVLTMSREDYNNLMLALGTAAGVAAQQRDQKLVDAQLALVDRLNVGNARYRPYGAVVS